jgi:CRP-like cAMP-binding protein
MFCNHFSRPFLKSLALTVKEVSYSEGETIFLDKHPLPNEAGQFYYIARGSILVYPNLSKSNP